MPMRPAKTKNKNKHTHTNTRTQIHRLHAHIPTPLRRAKKQTQKNKKKQTKTKNKHTQTHAHALTHCMHTYLQRPPELLRLELDVRILSDLIRQLIHTRRHVRQHQQLNGVLTQSRKRARTAIACGQRPRGIHERMHQCFSDAWLQSWIRRAPSTRACC